MTEDGTVVNSKNRSFLSAPSEIEPPSVGNRKLQKKIATVRLGERPEDGKGVRKRESKREREREREKKREKKRERERKTEREK